MKAKVIQLTIVLMMITASVFSQKANTNDVWASIYLKGKDKVEVRIIKAANEVVMMNVYDQSGKNVLSRRIKKESNVLISHNIKPFPYGTYTYEIKSGREVLSSTQIIKSPNRDLVYKPLESLAEAN